MFKIKTMSRILFIFAFLFPSTLNALSFDGKFIQGHFIIGKTQPETEIWIDKKKVKVSKDVFFAFGMTIMRGKLPINALKYLSEVIRVYFR